MHAVGDRFVVTGESVALDLATRGRVRLFVDARATSSQIAARTAICDRLAALEHPLLVPLVDYGACGRRWFEAHEVCGPVGMSREQARSVIPHLVRFLRAGGVELTADLAARNVRAAVFAARTIGRPVGVFLRARAAVDAIRTVLEADGPPGATVIDLVGDQGAGLRTACLQLARIARLAGYVVLDARLEPGAAAACGPLAGRHVCAIDWQPADRSLPPVLAAAAGAGARRHVWIRFLRSARDGSRGISHALIRLEPMMKDAMISAVFVDPAVGPTPADVRDAVERSHGWPGAVVKALAAAPPGYGAGWVHETAPAYGAPGEVPPPQPEAGCGRAGVARLRRAADAARALATRGGHGRAARLLARCASSLAIRGAEADAAAVACDLGNLLLARGQPAQAAAAFDKARAWGHSAELTTRALIGAGRALLDQARPAEAEAVFRTIAAADGCGPAARVWLARALWHRGQLDAAQAALGDGSPALLARILLASGRLDEAAGAARDALAAVSPDDPVASCEAHGAAAHVYAALRDLPRVRAHIQNAARAARRTQQPVLRLVVAAEAAACVAAAGGTDGLSRRRDRLLRASAKVPPLAAATIRAALASIPPHGAAPPPPRREADLVRHFEMLVDAIHDTPDEAAALQVIAETLLRTLRACSVIVRSARLAQVVAAAGRPWPGEETMAAPILNGAAPLARDGVTPEAIEPVRSAGAIIGSIAVRWVVGANPGWDRVKELLKATAAAAAPVLRALRTTEPQAADGGGYPDDLLGRSPMADRVREAIRRAAAAPFPVLIEGESGSGKELVARAIHARGIRRARRFCAVNCAALPEELLEAELFGHARGAFTGALSERPGLFEEADQGTLLLDEVGELSPRAQATLLRVLQEGEVRRVGENVARRVDVRVVAATNRSLEREVEAGRFRADLRFRLDVIRIGIPPLRERAEDVPWLVERSWADASARVGSRAVLGTDMIGALARYDWPGNVRELQNVIASLAVHAPRRGRVPLALLPARIAHEAARPIQGFDDARREFERHYIRAALARSRGCRAEAATQLRLSRQGLIKIMKRLGLE